MSRSLIVLSLGCLLLGVVALMIGDKKPKKMSELALTFAEFDEIVKMPIARISPVELADFLVKQQHHYNLVDLQGENASYQIPTAEFHDFSSFLDLKLPINETIIIYSTNETKALQLYYLLNIRGYFKMKVLTGGIQGWTLDILQPNLPSIDKANVENRKKLTRFFGGSLNRSETPHEIKPRLLKKKVKRHHGC